jgi:hypothetical protein
MTTRDAARDFELEVIHDRIVIRHRDGHVLSDFRPEHFAVELVEHSRYCEPRHSSSLARFLENGRRAAHEAASNEGWLSIKRR